VQTTTVLKARTPPIYLMRIVALARIVSDLCRFQCLRMSLSAAGLIPWKQAVAWQRLSKNNATEFRAVAAAAAAAGAGE